MLFTEQVIDCLHGVEGAKGNLYEDGVPVAHSTIPQSWQLKGLEFLAVLTLAADESCGLVDIFRQVEWLPPCQDGDVLYLLLSPFISFYLLLSPFISLYLPLSPSLNY